jgi:hypothetical protein
VRPATRVSVVGVPAAAGYLMRLPIWRHRYGERLKELAGATAGVARSRRMHRRTLRRGVRSFQSGLYSACGVARFQASSNAATISRMVRGSELKV